MWSVCEAVDASRSCASNPGRRLQNGWLVVEVRISHCLSGWSLSFSWDLVYLAVSLPHLAGPSLSYVLVSLAVSLAGHLPVSLLSVDASRS